MLLNALTKMCKMRVLLKESDKNWGKFNEIQKIVAQEAGEEAANYSTFASMIEQDFLSNSSSVLLEYGIIRYRLIKRTLCVRRMKMKKLLCIIFTCAILLSFSSCSLAERFAVYDSNLFFASKSEDVLP